MTGVYDHAQSPRLGQRTSVESTYVQMFSGDDIPEAAWTGQLIYRNETQALQIFNGNAWEDVVGGTPGTLTFIGSIPPVAQHIGDIWLDSGNDNRMYVSASVGADAIAAGEWEAVSAGVPPLTETTHIYQQDTPPGGGDVPPPKDNDFWYETPGNHQYYYLATAPGTHWIAVKDTGIDQAQSTADAAQAAADAATAAASAAAAAAVDANNAAADAMTAAEAAQATADGAITTYYLSDPPWANAASGHDDNAGDMWFDIDDGQAYRWNAVTKNWDVIEDSSIGAALGAANTAQATADAKITAYYATAQPWANGLTTHDLDFGDIWYDTDDKNKPYYWKNDRTWVSVRDGTIADVQADHDALAAVVHSDLLPPTSSPTPVVIGGIGALFARWPGIVNHDPVEYQVHISITDNFTPTADTLVVTTPSNSMTIRQLPTAMGDPLTTALVYNTTYYVKIIAQDVDGATTPSTQGSGQMVQITGPDIAAHEVDAEKIVVGSLTGDLFSGTVVTGSTLSTGAYDPDTKQITGARVDLGSSGLIIVDSDGNEITKFPLDPTEHTFIKQAQVDVVSLDVADNLALHGTNNEVSTEAELTLAAGPTAPSTPPTVTHVWDQLQLDITTAVPPHTPNPGYDLGTFALDPSQITSFDWVTTNGGYWAVFQQKSAGFRVWRFKTDGTILNNVGTGRPWVDDWNNRTNVFCTFHDTLARLDFLWMQDSGDWFIGGSRPDGVNEINFIPRAWIIDVTKPPALAYDVAGNKYMLLQQSGANTVVRRFHLVAGSGGIFGTAVVDGADFSMSGFNAGSRYNGLVYGSQVGTGTRYALAADSLQQVTVWDTTSTGYKVGSGVYESWFKPTATSRGFCHDGTKFASVDGTGLITFYADWTWTEYPVTTYIGASAYDSDAAGAGGTHETPVGIPLKQFTQIRRAKLQVTMPETNDSGGNNDPDKWRIYYLRSASVPTDGTGFKLAGTIGSPSAPTSISPPLSANPAGAAPPGGLQGTAGANNTFPGANPARIESGEGPTPLIQLVGDGSGKVGPLSWNASGVLLTTPMPPGSIMMWATATPPTGWLICDGSSKLNGDYPALSAVIRGTYGGADGSHFYLPDLKSRFPIGAGLAAALGNSDTLPGVLDDATRSGKFTHAHGHNHNHAGPNHQHTGPNHQHLITVTNAQNASGTATTRVVTVGGSPALGGGNGVTNFEGTELTGLGGTGLTDDDNTSGGSTGHAYTALNFIIKT